MAHFDMEILELNLKWQKQHSYSIGCLMRHLGPMNQKFADLKESVALGM